MKPSSPTPTVLRRRNRSRAAIGLAAADATLAALHARGLARFLEATGHRGEAHAARHVAERLDRALEHLAGA